MSTFTKRDTKDKSVVEGETFDIGDKVIRTGAYVCVPCGYKREYKRGDKFTRCFKCLKGTRDEGKPFIKNLGLWEYLG